MKKIKQINLNGWISEPKLRERNKYVCNPYRYIVMNVTFIIQFLNPIEIIRNVD